MTTSIRARITLSSFLFSCLLLGNVSALATSPVCLKYLQDACRLSIKTTVLKKEMKVFHWFTDQHYGSQQKPEAYVTRALDSFLSGKGDRGAALTGGFYLATDPTITCQYGHGKAGKPLLAVLTFAPGTRFSYATSPDEVPHPSECPMLGQLMFTHPRECFPENAVYTYGFNENVLEETRQERDVFPSHYWGVAFTAGSLALKQFKAHQKIYSWNDIKAPKTLEAEAILYAFQKKSACQVKLELPATEKNNALEAWQKKYLLAHSGSREFFEANESVQKPESKNAPKGEGHEKSDN